MTTVILPCHNEEAMLPQTINSIYNIDADEVIFLLDRCNDKTVKIIKRKAPQATAETRIVPVGADEGKDWNFRAAYLRRKAYEMAENDCIINTSADINLDPKIREYVKEIPKYGLISFGYLEKPWNIQQFLRILISSTSPIHGFAGLLAFSKKAWLKTEDLEELKKIKRSEDTHLHLAIESKYPTKHINTHSLHLRPNENTKDHYLRGASMYRVLHRSPLTVFLHSLIMVRPAAFTGYCHARRVDF